MTGAAPRGRLIVVGTPIGNLGDLSPRARNALAEADAIACEDTRRTGRLLQLTGLDKKPLLVANDHTELRRAPAIIERLAVGESVALVSDAGMPTISDPGRRLVAAVLDAGFDVDVVPGPTAISTALVLSGFDVDRFVFEGFLPRRGDDRSRQIAELAAARRAVVVYESPKRVMKTLADLALVCSPDRRVAVCRELTKMHEETVRGTFGEVLKRLEEVEPRGEYVLVIEGDRSRAADHSDDELRALLRAELDAGSSRRDAVAAIVAATGLPKRRVYDLSITVDANR